MLDSPSAIWLWSCYIQKLDQGKGVAVLVVILAQTPIRENTLDVEQSESTLLLPIGVGKAVADTLSHCFAANSALQKRG